MKRGVKWDGEPVPGIDRLLPDSTFMGFPLVYDRRLKQVAVSPNFWPHKKIVVGPMWMQCKGREQIAVLLHEAKHCLDFHLEIRALLLPFFWFSPLWCWIAARQEKQCDAFAAKHGYGEDLLAVLRRFHFSDGEFYPPFDERVGHLSRRILEQA